MTTQAISKRGRPKGTGLDDRRHLQAIAELIFKSNDLKPTTAIKSLGITNPSTVRRLRDKFNLQKELLLSQARNLADQERIGNSDKSKFSDLEDAELEQSIELQQTVSDLSSENSVSTCALRKKKDHIIVDGKTSRKKRKKKSKKSSGQKTANKRNQASLKKNSAKTKKASAPAKTLSKERGPSGSDPQVHMSLFNAWLFLGTQIVTSTIKTQLQLIELAEQEVWYKETAKIQTKVRDAWFCSMTPHIAIRNPS